MFRHTTVAPGPMIGGYIGVDLFFGLSGFVMALSYEERLRDGLSLGRFMALRAARLWPMLYVAGMLGYAAAGGWLGTMFLIPDPFSNSSLFPANDALWSLFFEMIAYVFFAIYAPRMSIAALAAFVAVSGLALAGASLASGHVFSDFGGLWSTLPHGLARVAYSFGCGVLIYRLRKHAGMPRIVSNRAWLIGAAFVAIALFEPFIGQPTGILPVLFGLPPLLWLASKWEVPKSRMVSVLANSSYPLYCIQLPLLYFGTLLAAPALATWIVILGLSLVLERWWDRPLRKKLTKWVNEADLSGWRTRLPRPLRGK